LIEDAEMFEKKAEKMEIENPEDEIYFVDDEKENELIPKNKKSKKGKEEAELEPEI
jgi:FMN phosphatase YigB (HAD superfamily)